MGGIKRDERVDQPTTGPGAPGGWCWSTTDTAGCE